ncbi:hypothetical protein E2P81_ATG10550 [Venturia nashicola]|nr:hypothetical protein E2P81_ATG10550 [Venturia nashicola]
MSDRLNWGASRRDCEEASGDSVNRTLVSCEVSGEVGVEMCDRGPKAGCAASGEETPWMGDERKQETGRGMGGEMSLAMGDVMKPKTGRGISGEVILVVGDAWERKVCRRKSREGSEESVDRDTASLRRARIRTSCWEIDAECRKGGGEEGLQIIGSTFGSSLACRVLWMLLRVRTDDHRVLSIDD